MFVTDPALAELRAIFARATGEEKPNNHGTVEEVWGDRILIVFDDGGSAPYPLAEVRALSPDHEVMAAGFYGYEGCPLLAPTSEGSCPTPYLCSEKGDCGVAAIGSKDGES